MLGKIMSGFWITLYKQTNTQYATDEVAGYLYCCEASDCTNVARVARKEDITFCPKCGALIQEDCRSGLTAQF